MPTLRIVNNYTRKFSLWTFGGVLHLVMVNDNYMNETNGTVAALADNRGELSWINENEIGTKEREDTLESYYRAELQQLNLIAKLND